MADEKTQVRFGILGCADIARKVCRAINMSPNATLHAISSRAGPENSRALAEPQKRKCLQKESTRRRSKCPFRNWARAGSPPRTPSGPALISSRSIEKAKQFATKNSLSDSVKVYGSYEEVLDDPFVDAVYVPLPTSLHLKWAVLAADKKKHVLLEKPTALNVGELDRILDACESNDVQFMDGSMWYHHPRTARMKDFILDSNLFGQVKTIYSSSSYFPPPEFFENNIRTKADLDAFGALGDAGWYCIGAILWAMNYKLPTTVTALPAATTRNSNGVIMSTTAAFHWEQEGTTATFYCSFLSHETMDVSVMGSKGSFHVEDLIIPYEESSAYFNCTSGAAFVDLHIGWNVKEQEVLVHNELPQEALMVKEFSRLVKGIKDLKIRPDKMWGDISRTSQVVLDAVKSSVDSGKMVYI